MTQEEIKERLEYLRGEIVAERISYGDIGELSSLLEHIPDDDVLLRELAGMPENLQFHTCKFVRLSDILDDDVRDKIWDEFSNSASFTWGNNNRTLITASRIAACFERTLNEEDKEEEDAKLFLTTLYTLGESYIDLEN